jgi:hypothetical protein
MRKKTSQKRSGKAIFLKWWNKVLPVCISTFKKILPQEMEKKLAF